MSPTISMKYFLNCVAALLLFVSATTAFAQAPVAKADGTWTGQWETHWSEGGGQITLEQRGDVVTGTYPLYGVRLEAKVHGREVRGSWSDGDSASALKGDFILTLGSDGKTFSGRFGTRGWWTGERVAVCEELAAINLRSPRDAFVAFLAAGNRAQAGMVDAWGIAADAVEFVASSVPPDPPLTRSERILRAASLFELIDLTTLHAGDVPENVAADTCAVRLKQSGTDVILTLMMHRDSSGDWRIVEPNEQQRSAARASLLARTTGKAPSASAHTQLQNPRATMRAFLEGMTHWNDDNGALARSTMDTSVFPEILLAPDSELSAQFLRHALDNIGLIGLQSIPDDGTDRTPYVHFVHEVGSIVLAPTGNATDAPWQFTGETVVRAPLLFRASTTLPTPEFLPPGSVEGSTYFRLRSYIVDYAPYLLVAVSHFEIWQPILVLSILVLSIIFAHVVSRALCRLLSHMSRGAGVAQPQPRWFPLALTVLLVVAVMRPIPLLLGIPANARQYTIPVFGSVVCISAMFVAWRVLSLLGEIFAARAARTEGRTDDIMLTFTIAVLRLGIVFSGLLGIATVFSISATNILAGLGIGGLAFAFASRETLSNVFGAGILVTDRPFRSGDWIQTDTVQGSVEQVGIRSTRVRTLADTIVVVPNGKLADSTINNLGARRQFVLNLFVTKGGTPARLQSFIVAIRTRLESDPVFLATEANVGIVALTALAVEIQLTAYCDLSSDRAESDLRHALLTDLIAVAEASGLRLSKGMQRVAK
jgi:MscS family membrane protein